MKEILLFFLRNRSLQFSFLPATSFCVLDFRGILEEGTQKRTRIVSFIRGKTLADIIPFSPGIWIC